MIFRVQLYFKDFLFIGAENSSFYYASSTRVCMYVCMIFCLPQKCDEFV